MYFASFETFLEWFELLPMPLNEKLVEPFGVRIGPDYYETPLEVFDSI